MSTSEVVIFISSISSSLYSTPSTTTNSEFSNLYSGNILTIASCENIILDVKHLYALVFIGCRGVSCISFKLGSTILPPAA